MAERPRYQSTRGVDRNSVPWRLWQKSKKLFWDPSDLDYSQDAQDWAAFTDQQRQMVAGGARGFMVGEEAVTLDILPLIRAISDEGRLEEVTFLTSFALEEAKHTDFFMTWFEAVGFDARPRGAANGNGDGYGGDATGGAGNGIFGGDLHRIMTRLDNDRSPEAYLDAAITYNQFVEGILAISGYKGWERLFRGFPQGTLSAFNKGLELIQRDERRHIAYGTYLCRRIISEHPETWDFVERRWAELTQPVLAQRQRSGGGGFTAALIQRRYDAMAVARSLKPDDVTQRSSVDELENIEPQRA